MNRPSWQTQRATVEQALDRAEQAEAEVSLLRGLLDECADMLREWRGDYDNNELDDGAIYGDRLAHTGDLLARLGDDVRHEQGDA